MTLLSSENELGSGLKMGINWLRGARDVDILEYVAAALLFLGWFFTIKVLINYYERKRAFRRDNIRKRI